jgi:hypothetical protein
VKLRLTCAIILALLLALVFTTFAFAADDEDTSPDPGVVAFISGQLAPSDTAPAEEEPAEEAAPTEETAPAEEAAPCEECSEGLTAEAQAEQPADDVEEQPAEAQPEEPAEEQAEEAPPASLEQDVAAGLEILEAVPSAEPAPVKKEKKVGEFIGPLPTRTQHPLHSFFFNFPSERARTLKEGQQEFAARILAASDILKETSGGAIVDLDLETWNYQFEYRRGAWGGEVTAVVPLRDNTHGIMDSTIESWHNFFGMKQGGRSDYPANDYHFFVRDPMGNILNVPSDQFGLGDISLSWKQEIGRSAPDHALSYRVGVKLPTGDSAKGLGSGGFDAGAGLAYETLGTRWAGYGNLNYIVVSRGDIKGFQINDIISGTLAAEYRLRPTWWLVGQFDYAQYPLTTGSSLDRDSLELLFGFHKLLEKGLIFSGGFSEDISLQSSPDISLIAEMRWRF